MRNTSRIAFKEEELVEAVKDFVGQIVATDYAMEPFGMKGAPGIQRTGKVLCVQIRTDAYEKDQYEWYPPSDKKKTKWAYLLEALTKCGAMKDLEIGGTTDEERMVSFARSLVGVKARFVESVYESMVTLKGGEAKKFNLIVPEEYMGKSAVEAEPAPRTAEVSEGML